jgi:hypothetical protein
VALLLASKAIGCIHKRRKAAIKWKMRIYYKEV